jgi:hypothetical protein
MLAIGVLYLYTDVRVFGGGQGRGPVPTKNSQAFDLQGAELWCEEQ